MSSLIGTDEGSNCNGKKFRLVSTNRCGENVAYTYAMILRGYLDLVHIHEHGLINAGVIKGRLHRALTGVYNPQEIKRIIFIRVILITGEVDLNNWNCRTGTLSFSGTAVLLLLRHDCVSEIIAYMYTTINQTRRC